MAVILVIAENANSQLKAADVAAVRVEAASITVTLQIRPRGQSAPLISRRGDVAEFAVRDTVVQRRARIVKGLVVHCTIDLHH